MSNSWKCRTTIINLSLIKNTVQLARWLNAKHYVSNYKPIPIEEFWTFDNSIYPASTSRDFVNMADQRKADHATVSSADEVTRRFKSRTAPIRWISESRFKELQNPVTNVVVSLAIETAKAGFGALIFCSNRKGCETLARLVSRVRGEDISNQVLEQRKEVLAELRSLPIGIDETLGKTVMRGVAFHRMCKLALESKPFLIDCLL